jgi:outer membrane cobalamin receptor
MKRLIISFWFCAYCLLTEAQFSIRGKVIDKLSREPLELAFVKLISTEKSTLTDKSGHFFLTVTENAVTDNASFIVSFIGYQSESIAVKNDNSELLVEMEKGVINLQEVVITSQPVAKPFHTLSKIDLNLQPVKSAQDILRIVPGLFIGQHQGGGKAEQIFLRGFDIDHGTDINVTVDGLPVNMVSHAHGQGYADLHFLIPELVANVDYGKGPYYSSFGNMGTAGFVSLNTINTLDKSTIKLEAGQFNTSRGLGMVDLLGDRAKEKGTSAYIASEFLYSDGAFDSPQHFNRFNIFGKFITNIGRNNKLTLIGSALNSNWDASGQIPERAVRSGSIGRFGAIDDTEGGYTSRTNASAKLTSYLRNNSTWENQFYFSHYNFNLHSNFTFFLNDSVNGDQIRQRESRNIFGYQSKLSTEKQYGKWVVQSVGGAGFRYDRTKGSELSHTINKNEGLEYKQLGNIRETNLFAFADKTIRHGKWLLNLGARLDYLNFSYFDQLKTMQDPDQSQVIVSPKINLHYTLSPKVQLYAKTGKGFHSNDARVVVFNRGDKILPAAYGTDIGLLWKPTQKLLVNIAAWYLYLQQEFVYVGDEGIVEPSGKTRRTGLDFSGRYQFNKWLFADINLNMAKPRSIEDPKGEDHIPLAPTFISNGGLSWQMKSGFNGSLRYRHLKDRPANENGSVIAKGYTVTDFAFNYTKKKYEVGLSIENLFNTKWNETQFNTESRLKDEPAGVEEIHFTPGVPFFARLKFAVFF